jgi:bifunctional DNA-binding transcriptional regulator/antitoxin component of YhaV-PrlF toxin-antitoxin module
MIRERVLIQKKGQLTIPIALRQKYDLEEGGVVELVEEENGFRIIPRLVLAEESLDKIGKILKKKGVSLNQMIGDGRKVRKNIFREKYAQEKTP